jgi:hypothetical protein
MIAPSLVFLAPGFEYRQAGKSVKFVGQKPVGCPTRTVLGLEPPSEQPWHLRHDIEPRMPFPLFHSLD